MKKPDSSFEKSKATPKCSKIAKTKHPRSVERLEKIYCQYNYCDIS